MSERLKIAIAEDEPDWQELVSEYVERIVPDADVVKVKYVDDLLSSKSRPFKVVILDIGLDTRDRKAYPNLRVEDFAKILLSEGTEIIINSAQGELEIRAIVGRLKNQYPQRYVNFIEKGGDYYFAHRLKEIMADMVL